VSFSRRVSQSLSQIFAEMNENDISYLIRGAAFKVHSALGPGLLESVYEVALSHELKTVGLEVQLMTYLKLTNKKLGLLINFNIVSLKYGIVRIVNNL